MTPRTVVPPELVPIVCSSSQDASEADKHAMDGFFRMPRIVWDTIWPLCVKVTGPSQGSKLALHRGPEIPFSDFTHALNEAYEPGRIERDSSIPAARWRPAELTPSTRDKLLGQDMTPD